MERRLFTLLFCLTLFKTVDANIVSIVANDSLLAEGKTWCSEYKISTPDNISGNSDYRILTVEGVYLYDHKEYKKIMEKDVTLTSADIKSITKHCVCTMREQDGKVYVLDTISGKESAVFDSSLAVGDVFSTTAWMEGIQSEVDFRLVEITNGSYGIDSDAQNYYKFDDVSMNFLESVGFTLYGAPYYEIPLTGASVNFICCHTSDGRCLYGTPGHDCPLDKLNDINAIIHPHADMVDNKNIYNLQGQRMAQPQTGLNIVGGRKVLVR